MKGTTSWSYRPYCPPLWNAGDIYICRLVPGKEKFSFDFLPDDAAAVGYTVHYRVRGTEEYSSFATSGTSVTVDGLADLTDYEF